MARDDHRLRGATKRTEFEGVSQNLSSRQSQLLNVIGARDRLDLADVLGAAVRPPDVVLGLSADGRPGGIPCAGDQALELVLDIDVQPSRTVQL
jgi:hypothetical protein